MNIKVVTGANYGDECKGLVSYDLAKRAKGNVLTVFYNGGIQRAHTVGDQILHCVGAGNLVGGDTFYDKMFLVDPIALMITESKVYIHPECRVVLPCDVLENRRKELARGNNKHGSCGLGVFECVKRSANPKHRVNIVDCFQDAENKPLLDWVQKEAMRDNGQDMVYNFPNFLRAICWMKENCKLITLEQIAPTYDEIIFEGGQGLLLDQSNVGAFPHLTPSSVGSYNIANEISKLGADTTEIFYVSRSYMTRHGRGPMEAECKKDDINPNIVDKTNMPNPWQDHLRFGYINQGTLYNRIEKDFSRYTNATANLVFTHMNYTGGELAVGEGKTEQIVLPSFVNSLYLSDQKDTMELIAKDKDTIIY